MSGRSGLFLRLNRAACDLCDGFHHVELFDAETAQRWMAGDLRNQRAGQVSLQRGNIFKQIEAA